MLQAAGVLNPDNTSVTNVYLLTGELGLQYGSRIYPVQYTYDYVGRKATMTTWTNFNNLGGSSGAAVTTWKYDGLRGWLTNKAYADGNGPSYTYTSAGRLATRLWARGITTTYTTNNAGDVFSVNYNDGTTAGITNGYDRRGRLNAVTNGPTVCTLAYNDADELLTEAYSGGPLGGLTVSNQYDGDLRRDSLALNYASTNLNSTAYVYDNASRLQTVTSSNSVASYSYVANSALVSQIQYKQSGTTRMTTTKTYDDLNRLTEISSVPGASGQLPENFNYTYNQANQRINDVLTDGSHWVYQYDKLGQVISGKRYWADGTRVAGQQYDYAFDDIGNRQLAVLGGDASGLNRRTNNYTANNLNQYTSRVVVGTNDIIGAAWVTNVVSVNGNTNVYRKGEYYQSTVGIINSSPAWLGVTVSSGGVTNTGNLFIAKTPESFGYDLDGNLTSDGHWNYVWDGENRLIAMTNNTSVAPHQLLNFFYDYKGRRIQKVESTNNGSGPYVGQYTNDFVYDGWNLIAVLNPQSSVQKSFMWGTDLSGSLQGAGGVGGLLEESYYGISTTNCFAAYDGNGNVTVLINAADGTMAANYEYGPFGEVIRSTGPMAKLNPMRFSTKFQDDESDLLYYGYRYYNPTTGGWPNRDPIWEKGGINLYGFVDNNVVNLVDTDGLFAWPTFSPPPPSKTVPCDVDEAANCALMCGLEHKGVGLCVNIYTTKSITIGRYVIWWEVKSHHCICYGRLCPTDPFF